MCEIEVMSEKGLDCHRYYYVPIVLPSHSATEREPEISEVAGEDPQREKGALSNTAPSTVRGALYVAPNTPSIIPRRLSTEQESLET